VQITAGAPARFELVRWSVFAVLVSMLLAWRTSRANRLTPSAPIPPLELPDAQRRPGDLYRARQRQHARKTGRRAA
jgi:hypothetical protein